MELGWFFAGLLLGGALVGVAFALLSAGNYPKGYIDAMNEVGRDESRDIE